MLKWMFISWISAHSDTCACLCCAFVQVRNEKARRYLTSMRKKQPVPFAQKFPNADPLALRLLERLLAFDPKDRPTAAQVCCDSGPFLFQILPNFYSSSRGQLTPL